MVIQPLSTRLIKPNFYFDLSHRRSTTVSLETRNSFSGNIFFYLLIVTEEKLQLAEEHIESLEQQLAESEKKVTEAAMKGNYFRVLLIVCEFCVLFFSNTKEKFFEKIPIFPGAFVLLI